MGDAKESVIGAGRGLIRLKCEAILGGRNVVIFFECLTFSWHFLVCGRLGTSTIGLARVSSE